VRRAHHDLRVWQEGMRLVEIVYRETAEFPDYERFGLISQMQRAAVSVPSNIAEGAGRGGDKEFLSLLRKISRTKCTRNKNHKIKRLSPQRAQRAQRKSRENQNIKILTSSVFSVVQDFPVWFRLAGLGILPLLAARCVSWRHSTGLLGDLAIYQIWRT